MATCFASTAGAPKLYFGASTVSRSAWMSWSSTFTLPSAVALVAEQLELLGELLRQVIADEAEVVVLGADLERALEPVLRDDRLPDREPEVIRIRGQRRLLLGRMRPHDVRVRLQRVEILVVRQEVGLAQQARVPIRTPSLRS